MSEVRYMTRLLSLLVASMLLMTCASSDHQRFAGNPCADGTGDTHPGHPAICIDDTHPALSVSPASITVWDEDRDGKPVNVDWYTVSGNGDVKINWKSNDCAVPDACTKGNCKAKTKKGSAGKRCQYDIELEGFSTLDPDVIITRCCTGG
jgi:hypothetical protein